MESSQIIEVWTQWTEIESNAILLMKLYNGQTSLKQRTVSLQSGFYINLHVLCVIIKHSQTQKYNKVLFVR